jgi:hypothetical protein
MAEVKGPDSSGDMHPIGNLRRGLFTAGGVLGSGFMMVPCISCWGIFDAFSLYEG